MAAKQRTIDQQVMSHTRKRGKELMKLIELDVVGFDLFDMAPVKEYELYIKSFGRSNTKQVSCIILGSVKKTKQNKNKGIFGLRGVFICPELTGHFLFHV